MDSILFTNLDGAYDSCFDMYNTVKGNGVLVRDTLKRTIESLRVNWEGSDATAHLNNLIKVYNSIDAVVVAASMIAASVGDSIVNLQEARQANGGSGNVGGRFTKIDEGGAIAEVPTTDTYKCEPAAEQDKAMLETVNSQYATFSDLFISTMESLLGNWQSGLSRDAALSLKDEFSSAVDGNKKYFTDAIENLTIAINNIKNLNA